MVSTSLVTRSAAALEMDTPSQIIIKPSKADPEKLGVWCKELIKEGTKFGPFVGEKAYEVDDNMDPAYIWEIVDIETKEFLFYINATNPHSGNWMRHIKCARYFEEQNIVSEQEGIDIFYQAIKDISPGEELLTWFEKSPLRRKKGKRRAYPNIKRAKTGKLKPNTSQQSAGSSKADAYADVNYVSQRGRKRSVKKYWQMEADSDANHDEEKLEESEDELLQELSDEDWEAKEVKQAAKVVDKPAGTALPVESSTGFFQFELQVTQTGKNRLGRKVFQCDICSGIYRHSFSLKRHYIRNHINYKYVSKVDRLNCSIVCETDPAGDDEGRDDGEIQEEKDDGSSNEMLEDSGEEENGSQHTIKDAVNTADVNKKDNDCGEALASSSGSRKTDLTNKDDKKDSDKQTSEVSDLLGCKAKLNEHKTSSSDGSEQKGIEAVPSSLVEGELTNGVGQEGSSEQKAKFPLPGLYRCNICEQLYDTVDQLKEHFLNHPSFPSDKKFSCEHCRMKFKHKQNLMRHEVVHTGAKPYICNHCNKRFPTLTNQKRHERIHKGQKFTCSQCPGTFTQTGDLKKHMCKQHPETYNECGYCSKYFSSESILAGHLQKVHNKDIEANHQKICARKKARKVSLEKDRAESRRLASDQMESHSKSDPSLQFACTICRKRFRDYSNMCRHRRLAHEREASNLELQWGNSDDGTLNDADGYFSDTDSQPDGEKMDALQMYFSHVSHNISNNLQHFIEGKEEQLTKASSHIRWKQKTALEKLVAAEKITDINLEEFNFPQGFQIRQLSELYESSIIKASGPLDDDEALNKLQNNDNSLKKCLKQNTDLNSNTSAMSKSNSPLNEVQVEQSVTIRVPEIKTCPLCHSIFHSTAMFISHMSEMHNQSEDGSTELIIVPANEVVLDDTSEDCAPLNYSTKSCPQMDNKTGDVKLNCDELPLDLSAGTTLTSADLVVNSKSDTSETVQVTKPLSNSSCSENASNNKIGKKFLCLVCFSEFADLTALGNHQSTHHASVDCRHAEVDLNFSTTWCKQPNSVGALNVSSCQLPQVLEGDSTVGLPCICTKCKNQFPSNEALHQHIADCGDYWRHLNNRVTWVFVLRGSELPMEKVVKKRGKFHWSNSPEESSRKQLQRMLLQQHLGEAPTDGTSSKARFGGRSVARLKSMESLDDDPDLRRNRWRHGHQSAYNPRRHVRRREMAELVDVQKCRGCGEEFKTILQLERHIPVCVEKNRIKDLHAEKTENGENSDEENDYDPTKHMCIYCERQFTYLRMLKKHVTENCSVRKEFVEKGEYVDEEWEQEITNKVQISSRDSGQNFNETVVADDGESILDNRRNKRRKRGNNWGCRAKTKKSFKSPKSSDDGDSLFGWEDAFLNAWAKKEGNSMKGGCGVNKNNENQTVPALEKAGNGTSSENTSLGVDSSLALQKLLLGDLNPELVEAEREKVEEMQTYNQEAGKIHLKPLSPVSGSSTNKVTSSEGQQEFCKTELDEDLALEKCDTDQLQMSVEDVSAADVKQKLISKIHFKRVSKSEIVQEDAVASVEKSSDLAVEPDVRDSQGTEQGTNVNADCIDKGEAENGIHTEEANEKEEEEEVPCTKVRKRRGPRLTMKSKKRKTVNAEPKAKAQQAKQVK